jgi:hypothetical protein
MTTTATAPTPSTPAAAAPAAPAVAPAESVKAAPISPLQLGDANKIVNADNEEFGRMFGIDAILAGTPFEQSPAAAAAATAASAGTPAGEPGTGETAIDLPTDTEGEVLPAYREDSKGNLHAPDGKFVAKDGAAPDGGAEAVTDPATPEGEGAPDPNATPAEPVKLATDFNLLDAENQEVEYPTDLKIKFTANGKEIELPLDRTVRLAKMGFYNEEKEARFEQSSAQSAARTVRARAARGVTDSCKSTLIGSSTVTTSFWPRRASTTSVKHLPRLRTSGCALVFNSSRAQLVGQMHRPTRQRRPLAPLPRCSFS